MRIGSDKPDAGRALVLRDVIGGRVWTAKAVTLVEDRPEQVALCLVPGAPTRVPSAYEPFGARETTRTEVIAEAERGDWTLRPHTWQRSRVLILMPREAWFSVQLYFDPQSDAFVCWYVNFQDPFRPSPIGFDTRDLALDLIVGPDHRWGWKDEDEFAQLLERRMITADEARLVRHSGDEVIARVEAREPPFDDTWIHWRPEPEWPVPALIDGWETLGAPSRS